jgi:hypothetical protein
MAVPANTDSLGIARNESESIAAGQEFILSDTPAPVTQDFLLPAALGAVAQYTPLSRAGAGGTFAVWAAGQPLAAILPFSVDTAGGAQRRVLYVEGMFNQDMIKWPNGTTEAQIEAAQTGNIRCRKPLYSDKRTGNEVVGVQAGGASV